MRSGIRQRLERLEREKTIDLGDLMAEMIRKIAKGETETDWLRGRKVKMTRAQAQEIARITERLREVENERDARDS